MPKNKKKHSEINKRSNTVISKNQTLRVMYEQQLAHLSVNSMDGLIKLIENKLRPKRYAVILHDKDTDEKGKPAEAHIHLMLSFENARSINSVAKLLGYKAQYIEAWKGDSNNGYAYLIHATDNARTKHQYAISEVTANFDYSTLMKKVTAEVKKADTYGDAAKIKTFLNLLYIGAISKSEVEKQLSGAQYAKAKKQIEDVYAKYLKNHAEEWRKQMIESGKAIRVIWMYGKTGTGKTSFAKEYAKKAGNGQPFYVAGSSRDMFQSYKGEHIIILDELRAQSIPYNDLLRVLDPFGIGAQVYAPSRFYDKALAADLIIITTPTTRLIFTMKFLGINPTL
ncbi:Rep family protein [Parablautia muri]|uniref:Rep family protein n=1 Tax=Parablautia muri TaxID=2320879 RepID=UPI00136DE99B